MKDTANFVFLGSRLCKNC